MTAQTKAANLNLSVEADAARYLHINAVFKAALGLRLHEPMAVLC